MARSIWFLWILLDHWGDVYDIGQKTIEIDKLVRARLGIRGIEVLSAIAVWQHHHRLEELLSTVTTTQLHQSRSVASSQTFFPGTLCGEQIFTSGPPRNCDDGPANLDL